MRPGVPRLAPTEPGACDSLLPRLPSPHLVVARGLHGRPQPLHFPVAMPERETSVSERTPPAAAMLVEASRAARDLHDEVAQTLFAIGATAKLLLADPALPPQARAGLERTLQLSGAASRQLRAAIHGLRAASRPTELGLVQAVEELAEATRARAAFDISLDLNRDLRVVDGISAEVLYRVCRESLANVERHAQASSCRVGGRLAKGWATVTIEDDGVGKDDAREGEGFGLTFLAEIVEGLGGSLDVGHRVPSGTVVTARVPVAP
jgi:signal transduction histidine kinase